MAKETVSARQIQAGDIIAYHDYQGNRDGVNNNASYALVYAVAKIEGHVRGYEVLPIDHFPKDQFLQVKGDQRKYLITSKGNLETIQQMGLSLQQNHVLNYHLRVIENSEQHLKKRQGSVTRIGSVANTDFFDRVLEHAGRLDLSHAGLVGLTFEDEKNLSGMRSSGALSNIELFQLAPKGKNIHVERERQETPDGTSREPKKTRRKKRHALTGKGVTFDIRLQDAAKIGLISQETVDAVMRGELATENKKPVETLKDLHTLCAKDPSKLQGLASSADALNLSIQEIAEQLEDPAVQKRLEEQMPVKSMRNFITNDIKNAAKDEGRSALTMENAELMDYTITEISALLTTNANPDEIAAEAKSGWKAYMDDLQAGLLDTEKYDGIETKFEVD